MGETTKTYAELMFPGSFFSEDSVIEVSKRDPVALAKKHENAFSIRFFDLTSTEVVVDGVKRVVSGERKNLSPLYFPDGKIKTLAQIKKMDAPMILSNMECNGWDRVVRTRRGTYQPFESGCEIIKTTE
jgi:hypothetical protein